MRTLAILHAVLALSAHSAHSALSPGAAAGDLAVTDVSLAGDADRPRVELRVSWANGWRNERNHDGAWVFVKVREPGSRWWLHAPLGGPPVAGEGLEVSLPDDRVGCFVFAAAPVRGRVGGTVALPLATEAFARVPFATAEVHVRALEMVHVPEGPFTLGDPGERGRGLGSLYRSDGAGGADGLVRVESEGPIEVGAEAGMLDYEVNTRAEYEGDRGGPLGARFPKGHRAFWIQKYELTQGEYADFLDHLPDDATAFRANFAGRGYREKRGTIRLEGERYVADSPGRALNFVSWDDGCAFLDWAGLRPMTELEFTKACRGPRDPIAGEFPWGTASKARLARVVGEDEELVTGGPADESTLTDETREVHGASHYWVMDLAGSLWERVVSIGHPRGRAFEGTHGDGRLTSYGSATNADWPSGDDVGGGYGYRGGGWYGPREYEPDGFNPHSPVSWRRFGGWGQGPRYVAYGFRGVRTAPGP